MTRDGIIAWSPDRLYWAVLDPPSGRRSSLLFRRQAQRRELEFALEGEIPVPLESVHATFTPLDDERVLACAVARDELKVIGDALSLAPSALPGWIDAEVDAASIELLTGSFTPRRIMGLRRHWALVLITFVVIALGLISVGLELRVRAAASERQQVKSEFGAMLTEAGFEGPPSQARMQLIGRIRTLEQAAPDPSTAPALESMVVAALVLQAWPDDETIELGSIEATGERVVISAAAPDASGAGDLASAMESALVEEGWRAMPPDVMRLRGGVRITLRFEQEEGGS